MAGTAAMPGDYGGAGPAAPAAAGPMPRMGAERWARPAEGHTSGVDLMVPGIRCAGCMRAIETGLGKLEGVTSARVNLSLRRVRVRYDPALGSVEAVLGRLGELGYEARPFDAAAMAEVDRDSAGRDLLVRLAVAGFAAMNVMLLSVSVWAGAEAATRDLMHWISALIALPAIAYWGCRSSARRWGRWRGGASTWTCRSRWRCAWRRGLRSTRPSRVASRPISTPRSA